MTETVRLKLYEGNIIAAGRKSPVSLYNTAYRHHWRPIRQRLITRMTRLALYDSNGLRLKVAAEVGSAS